MPTINGFHIHNSTAQPKSLKISMFRKKWKFHRDIPETPVFAYGTTRSKATVPGPTIEARHGVSTRILWQNHLPEKHILPFDTTIPIAKTVDGKGIPTVVHLHGGIDEPSSDGNANSWFTRGFKHTGPAWTKKTYHYHNQQHPGNAWYHDHAMGLTRVNILSGLLGAYIIRHPELETPLGLPTHEFDRVLVVFDRSFTTRGSIYMNRTGNNPSIHPQWQPEYFGDAVIVNGKAWPRLLVRRRKYRFRIVNAANARFFRLFFANGIRFVHLGSDSAYLEHPVVTNTILLAPSEIADVVVDFSESRTNSTILKNDAVYPYPSGDPTNGANGEVMKFVIRGDVNEIDTARVPRRLIKYPAADLSRSVKTRHIAMYEYTSKIGEPTHLYLNAKSYSDRATELLKVGTNEVWEVINLTEDNHPLHIHLGLFKVLDQTELVNKEEFLGCMTRKKDALKCGLSKYAIGQRVRVPKQESGWKNVFKMRPGCVTRIFLRVAPIHTNQSYTFDATAEPGYVYHCHILDHEDNVMMRPLKIVK